MDKYNNSPKKPKIFTVLDALWRYWKEKIRKGGENNATLTPQLGTKAYTYIELVNGPFKTFQRSLDFIQSRFSRETYLNYIGDIFIIPKDTRQHVNHTGEVPTLLCQTSVTLKLRECDVFQNLIEYLDHVLMPGRLC